MGRIITKRLYEVAFPDKVADLIDWASWNWDYDLLQSTFWPVDVHNILQVSFGSPATVDRVVWAFLKSGKFTVRSCYHNLLEGKIGATEEVMVSREVDGMHWNWLWKLRIPPKVRVFLWRACHDIIPTRCALVRRHVGSEPFCEFCKREVETESHLFFKCLFFASLWLEPPFNLGQEVAAPKFATGLGRLKELLSGDDFLLACVVLCNVWNFRNGTIHDSVYGERVALVDRSRDCLSSYSSARIFFPLPVQVASRSPWQSASSSICENKFRRRFSGLRRIPNCSGG